MHTSRDELRRQSIREVVAECRRLRAKGDSITDESVIAEHPDLMPDLGEALRHLQLLEAARARASSEVTGIDESADSRARAPRREGLWVRCPHCQGSVRISPDASLANIDCNHCGNQFNLAGDDGSSGGVGAAATLGHLVLMEKLGSGSFGSVFKARDTELDRLVAVKIPRRIQHSTGQIEQFLREARAVAQLNHPNIVHVHEVGRDDETVYIVTDFVEGEDLSQWRTKRPPSHREVATICRAIAEALDYAHERGIVHRDLKPSNILVDGTGMPHLLDFGLARREACQTTVTLAGQIVGTPAYMSPEQAKGQSHDADRRSDVYSLGVILFELLTGALPFRGNPLMLARQVIHDEPPSVRRLNNTIPRDLETICLTCLEKEPAKRYATARELADEFERFLSGRPILARPITSVAKGWRWAKRNRREAILGATAAGLGLVLSVGGPITAILQAASARRFRWQNYVSDMIVANHAWETANVERVLTLLGRHVPKPGQDDLRGFEWYYLWRLCRPSETTRAFPLVAPAWVAFSPDGKKLAATGRGRLHLWDLETNQELRNLDAHTTLAPGLAFSPDGRMLATASWDGTLKLWNFSESGEPTILNQWKSDEPLLFQLNDLAISPNSRLVATNGPGGEVLLWDVQNQTVRQLDGHKSQVWYLAFSPDGQHLASSTQNDQVFLWNFHTGEYFELAGHGTGHTPVAFSPPDGATLVCGGEDELIRLWDVASRELKATLEGHTLYVSSLSCSPDGKTLASGSRDGTVNLWDMHTHEELATLRGHGGNVLDVAFAPDGRTIASAGLDGKAKLWDVAAATRRDPFEGDRVAYSVRDGALLTWGTDGALSVWGDATGMLKASIPCPEDGCVDRSPDGKRIALGHPDGRVEVHDTSTGERRTLPERHLAKVAYVTFSPKGRYLASVGPVSHGPVQDLTQFVKIWDLKEFTRATTLETFQFALPAFSPDDKTLAISSRAREAEIYAIELYNLKGKRLARFEPQDPVFSLAFSGDGAMLAAGIWNGEIHIWDVKTGRQSMDPLKGHTGHVESVAFSPDNRSLASASRDRTVKLWDLSTGAEMISLTGHRRYVVSVAFSPDGRTLASADTDGVVKLWRAASKEEVRAAGW